MSLSTAINDVRAFHKACDVPVSKSPAWPSKERVAFRTNLLLEEMSEIGQAIGGGDLVGITQELAGLIHAAIGMGLELGLPLGNAWDAIHSAHMHGNRQGADIETIVSRARIIGQANGAASREAAS